MSETTNVNRETATRGGENAGVAQETETKRETERDDGGRFTIGNPGGPGNPFARRVAELRKAMLAAVTAEDIAAILVALIVKAKEGNVQAAKLVLAYTVGKPEAVADPDRVDAHEWQLQKETAAMMPELGSVTQSPPAEVPLRAARVLRPLVGSIALENMSDIFRHPENHFPEVPDLVMKKDKKETPKANGFFDGLGARNPSEEVWLNRLAEVGAPSANGKSGRKGTKR